MRNRRVRLSAYLGLTAVLAGLGVGATAQRAYAHIAGASVDARATLLFGGAAALLTGKIQGTSGERAWINVIIQQTKGQQVVTGANVSEPFVLTGGIQTWQVTADVVLDPSASFASGPATVLVVIQSEDPADVDDYDILQFSARVSLHK